MKKQCTVIILPAQGASCLAKTNEWIKGTGELRMIYSEKLFMENILHQIHPQAMYILSDEEIKEGDWCIYRHTHKIWKDSDFMVTKIENTNYSSDPAYRVKHTEGYGVIEGYRKIIATTNKSLGLPMPSKEFIEAYVKAYNEGKPIEKVEVEYEEVKYFVKGGERTIGMGRYTDGYEFYVIPKVNSDSTINITVPKNEYTRKEVADLICDFVRMKNGLNQNLDRSLVDKWMEENL